MRFSPIILAAALIAAAPAHAQSAQASLKVRGVLVDVGAHALTLTRTSDAKRITVALPASAAIRSVSRAELSDIKPDSFIGTAATRRPDGKLEALEVHIFAPSLRGSGEGFRPWQGAGGATGTMTNGTVGTMTNGTVGSMVNGTVGAAAAGKGDVMTMVVNYRGGRQTVIVPSYVPVVYMAPGRRSLLKPGQAVLVFASRDAKGGLTARSVVVGKDGLVPPM